MGNFFRDAIEFVVDSQFRLVMRNDVAVWTLETVSDRARGELLFSTVTDASTIVAETLRRRADAEGLA